jgi:methylamine---corrinoid protein Co-methyltransferase
MMKYNYLDIIERSNTGLKIKKEDWDLDFVVMTTRKLVKKYNLQWDKEQIVPSDPNFVDAVFRAGLELVQTIGVYCISTGRVIQFDPSELKTGLENMPRELIMGEGKDVRTLFARDIMDQRPPMIWAGNPGVPTPENIFLPMVMSWMQEPIVDLITCGSLPTVDGHTVKTGEPIEIIATRRELTYLREGLRRVERPGMGMLAAQSSVSELGDLSVAHPDYLRSCDSHVVAMFNELIIDNGNMARVANSLDYGMRNASLATAMVGGLGGGAPGTAVVQVASFIAANLVCMADYHLLHPIDIRHVATSTPAVMWVQGVVEQAFARNAPCVIVSDVYPKSGAMTEELLYEVAANSIAITVSGGHLEGSGSADGALPNGTGLEARLMGEIGHAVAKQGITLEQANSLILDLLPRYEHVFSMKGGNPGVCFDEAYDLEPLKPKPEWLAIYQKVVRNLREMGLEALPAVQ